MSVRAELTVPDGAVTPGSSLTAHLRVWNESRVVDAYRLRLIGAPAAWPGAEEDLGQLPVYPGCHETIGIPLTLPRDSGLAPRPLPFAVRVSSVEDADAVAVPEALLCVGAFQDTRATVVRARVGGALFSSNLILLENTGNAPSTVRLRAEPEAEGAPLAVRPRRSRLVLGPGERARVALTLRVMRPLLVGTAADWTVRAYIGPDPLDEREVSFVHHQRPLLPKAVLKAVVVLLALLVAFGALWLSPAGGGKPKVTSESAKGPSQLEAVRQAEKESADASGKEREEEQKQQEAQGALKKKPFRHSLTADSAAGRPAGTYTVEKGYRLSVKTVQITSSGPASGTLVLKAGSDQLVSVGLATSMDYTPAASLSLRQGSDLLLRVDCPVSPAPPTASPTASPAASGGPAPACLATAVVTGELIPLSGPDSEPIDAPPSAAPSPSPSPSRS
ncbi:hypothetical protein [Streptomyces sp. NPDC092307]|uniref:COG1470 family protein n=1 Tax=Streptomyces sp. NPDC092307 TaxID=3366013 RepID=UPI0037FC21BF